MNDTGRKNSTPKRWAKRALDSATAQAQRTSSNSSKKSKPNTTNNQRITAFFSRSAPPSSSPVQSLCSQPPQLSNLLLNPCEQQPCSPSQMPSVSAPTLTLPLSISPFALPKSAPVLTIFSSSAPQSPSNYRIEASYGQNSPSNNRNQQMLSQQITATAVKRNFSHKLHPPSLLSHIEPFSFSVSAPISGQNVQHQPQTPTSVITSRYLNMDESVLFHPSTPTPKRRHNVLSSSSSQLLSSTPPVNPPSNITTTPITSTATPKIIANLPSLSSSSTIIPGTALIQTVLDLGQKNAGLSTCKACGMRFTHAAKEDSQLHMKYHASVLAGGIEYKGYSADTRVELTSTIPLSVMTHRAVVNASVIMLQNIADLPHAHRRKVAEVLDFVNAELGAVDVFQYQTQTQEQQARHKKQEDSDSFKEAFNGGARGRGSKSGKVVLTSNSSNNSSNNNNSTATKMTTVAVRSTLDSRSRLFLYLLKGRVIGCLLAEPIETAFRLTATDSKNGGDGCCSNEKTSIAGEFTGNINIGHKFLFGCVISKEQMAFSQPTAQGSKLAAEFFGKPDFLVYV
ncbi:N-acetyltransferase esco2 [Physocladia obscura]|uniref:N-acetyltransferase esco2 n=1 Tax=Physocladia obscura TaxID=109957 RepID=A0AAD5TBD5_9FUNG|nr:N-acetyltransferase esco2 [Physocladia obscura]